MSRFYYYLVMINMIANIISAVPTILLRYRNDGAVLSLIVGIILGLVIVIVYTKFFNAFPGKAFPELLVQTTSKWFYYPLLFFMAVMWFIAGISTLITYSFLLIRYLTPEIPIMLIGLTLILSIIFGCFMKTDRVLYTIEIVFVINFPIIIFIIIKAYTSKNLNWDFIREAMLHVVQAPNIHAVSSSIFLFLGVVNLVIFNRFFTQKQNFGLKQIIVLVFIAIATTFTTYFIPIGFHGSESIGELVYPWIATSDSMRMRYFVIERLVYVFLLLYLSMAFLSILIHWHVAVELFKFIFKLEKMKFKGINIGYIILIVFFTVSSLYIIVSLTEYQLFQYSKYFFNIAVVNFFAMIFLFIYIIRRMKGANKKANES